MSNTAARILTPPTIHLYALLWRAGILEAVVDLFDGSVTYEPADLVTLP